MNPRHADHAIEPAFLLRSSPRAMSGVPVSHAELLRLVEAARWAPSASNIQPWRFALCPQDDASFAAVLDALAEGNRVWCVRAGAFIVIAARTVLDDGRPHEGAVFDTGAAWMSIALQGRAQGLVIHGMLGFDQARVRASLRVPESLQITCVVAVGLPGDPSLLPAQHQAREVPNGRRPIVELAARGAFPEST